MSQLEWCLNESDITLTSNRSKESVQDSLSQLSEVVADQRPQSQKRFKILESLGISRLSLEA